jgi:hypothetical protein
MNSNIIAHCIIRGNTIMLNGKIIYQQKDKSMDLEEFLTAVYRHWEINYPKFHKMDLLSKLAFITAEKLMEIESIKPQDLAIVLSNKSSSIISDTTYQKSIQYADNYFPSPAVFVYTLANIMVGELCIKHKISGENIVFITQDFEVDSIIDYTNILLENNLCKTCLCGRIEASGNEYEAFFYVVEKEYALDFRFHKMPHNAAMINQLYHQPIAIKQPQENSEISVLEFA